MTNKTLLNKLGLSHLSHTRTPYGPTTNFNPVISIMNKLKPQLYLKSKSCR